MNTYTWVRRLFDRKPRTIRKDLVGHRPRLEPLEDRTLPSNIGTAGDLVTAIQTAVDTGGATMITLAANTPFDFTLSNNLSDGANALPVIHGGFLPVSITIVGNGDTIERSGTAPFRLFDVGWGGSLILQNLTLSGGLAQGTGSAAEGGAIYSSGTLNLSGVTLQGNQAQGANGTNPNATVAGPAGGTGASGYGGGLYVAGGTATLTNDTISGNTALGGTGGTGGAGVAHFKSRPGQPLSGTFFFAGSGGSGGEGSGGGLYVEGGTVTLNNDTFSSNNANGGAGGGGGSGYHSANGGKGGAATGGGLDVEEGSTITLNNDTLVSNNANGGKGGQGGYATGFHQGTPRSPAAYFTGGKGGGGANGMGGGLYLGGGGVTLVNDTLSSNAAKGGTGGTGGSGHGRSDKGGAGGTGGSGTGGGLYIIGGSTTLTNTLIAVDADTVGPKGQGGTGHLSGINGAMGSLGSASDPDVSGTVTSSDHDLIGDSTGFSATTSNHDVLDPSAVGLDPQGPQNNGGPTQTIALVPGSAALGAGNPAASGLPLTDQRGFARVVNNAVDIGAYEVQPITFSPTTLGSGNYDSYFLEYITATEPGCSSFVFLLEGALPNGMLLGPGGLLAGIPQTAGSFSFTVLVTDANGFTASQPYTLNIAPATPTVTVSDGGGIYNAQPFQAVGSAVGIGGQAAVSGSFTYTYYASVFIPILGGTFLVQLGGAPTAAGSYMVQAAFTSSDPNYANATSALTSFTIAPATPQVNVADGGNYSGSSIAANATAVGVDGVTPISGRFSDTYYAGSSATGTPLATPPTSPGTYTVVSSFTSNDSNYTNGSAQTTFTIGQATPTVSVSDAGGTYNGNAFSATDSVAGVVAGIDSTPASTLEGTPLTLTYYSGTYNLATLPGSGGSSTAPTAAGSYTVVASFAGSTDYSSSQALANFTIAQASPTVFVSDAGGTYNGSAFPATALVWGVVAGVDSTPASTLEGVTPTLTYYQGSYTTLAALNTALAGGLTGSTTAPTSAGSYTVAASFPGSTDYASSSSSALANFSIARANASFVITAYAVTYDGTAHTATGTATGIVGQALSGLVLSGTTRTNAGDDPSDSWTFTDTTGNYNNAGGTVHDSIARAKPTVQVSDAGGTYNGNAFPAADSVAGVVAGVDSTPASTLEGIPLTLTYYSGTYTLATLPGSGGSSTAPTAAGNYTAVASFAGSTDYSSSQALANFTIAHATPTISVSDGGTYNQSPFAATATVAGVNGIAGASLENVTPTLTYYAGPKASGTPLSGAPLLPGTYTVVASFAGSSDYAAANATTTFLIATPTTSITGPTIGVPGQPLTDTFTVTGPTQMLVFSVNYGDSTSPTTIAGGPSIKLDHLYTATGTFTIQVTAKDQNGVVSQLATQLVNISTVAMEADPSGGTDLAIGGKAAGGDTILVSAANTSGTAVSVNFDKTAMGTFTPTGHILVYGQGSKDTITLQPYVVGKTTYYLKVPALLYGEGSGGDHISAAGSAANNVLTGHGANEVLTGGQGRDMLIAGTGAATLNAGVGDDLLIGGSTSYDIGSSSGMTYDQQLASLYAIMAEWGSTDSYATRLSALGSYLNTSTVHDNSSGHTAVADQLVGNANANDWFFAGVNDAVKGKSKNAVVTSIT
jgi:hypothetical protein